MMDTPLLTMSATSPMSRLHHIGLGGLQHVGEQVIRHVLCGLRLLTLCRVGALCLTTALGLVPELPLAAVPPVVAVFRPRRVRGYFCHLAVPSLWYDVKMTSGSTRQRGR